MSFTFDAALKDLARENPGDVLTTFDRPPKLPITLLNVDLSTVTTAADLVVGLGQPLQEIIHLDFQSSAAANKHADTLVYNALLFRHYLVPVHSMIILLRPQAAHSNLNGLVGYASRPERSMNFSYEVVRLWERQAEEILAGPLGSVPLAPLGQMPPDVPLEHGMASIIQRLANRLIRESPPDKVKHLLTTAFLLTGLRVRREVAKKIFLGVIPMRESDTYLAIIDEGKEEALKKIILRLGQKRFGPPSELIKSKVMSLSEIDLLEQLAERLLDVSSWQELLETQ